MFSWFRRPDRPPPPAAENPGRGHTVRVAFANAHKSWEEEDDLAASLAATLNAMGHKASVKRDWVELEGGFSLVPQVVNVKPMDSSGVQTVTTIQISHPVLVPGGVFEFQHSTGDDIRDSFAQGFKAWAERSRTHGGSPRTASSPSRWIMGGGGARTTRSGGTVPVARG